MNDMLMFCNVFVLEGENGPTLFQNNFVHYIIPGSVENKSHCGSLLTKSILKEKHLFMTF